MFIMIILSDGIYVSSNLLWLVTLHAKCELIYVGCSKNNDKKARQKKYLFIHSNSHALFQSNSLGYNILLPSFSSLFKYECQTIFLQLYASHFHSFNNRRLNFRRLSGNLTSKSHGAKSGLYRRWSTIFMPQAFKKSTTVWVTWGYVLSWCGRYLLKWRNIVVKTDHL